MALGRWQLSPCTYQADRGTTSAHPPLICCSCRSATPLIHLSDASSAWWARLWLQTWLGQPRLMCCCKRLCFQAASLLLPVLLTQEQEKLKTHPHPKPFHFCKRSESFLPISDGICWAVVSCSKHCSIFWPLPGIFKCFRWESRPVNLLQLSQPSCSGQKAHKYSLCHFSPCLSLPPNLPPAIFPHICKQLLPSAPALSPWEPRNVAALQLASVKGSAIRSQSPKEIVYSPVAGGIPSLCPGTGASSSASLSQLRLQGKHFQYKKLMLSKHQKPESSETEI